MLSADSPTVNQAAALPHSHPRSPALPVQTDFGWGVTKRRQDVGVRKRTWRGGVGVLANVRANGHIPPPEGGFEEKKMNALSLRPRRETPGLEKMGFAVKRLG